MATKKIGNSIFSWEQEAGIDSPLGNWRRNNTNTESNVEEKTNTGDKYDYLPVVKINDSEDAKNAIVSIKDCNTHKKDKISLGTDYDEKHRNYLVADIVIAQNSTARIPLMIKRGYDPFGFQDNDGILSFKSSNASIDLNFIDSDDTDYKDGEDKYDVKKSAYGDEFIMEVTTKRKNNRSLLSRGVSFTIIIDASDDEDDFFSKSDRKGICGKFNIQIVTKDVFIKEERDKVVNEILYVVPFVDDETAPEYDENYCMQAAERSLSELFQNDKDFYSVERKTHKHKNSISFSGKNAIDRGRRFKKLGYVKKEFEFDDYKIDHVKRKSIVDNSSYEKVRYNIISLKNKKLQNFFDKVVSNNIGYHIFYFTVTSGFHTLMLIIDNTEPCEAKYTIYDQHGETSSKGLFKDTAEGIKKQTCWTFANTCLNRYKGGVNDKWDSTETTIWKMQRK